MRYLKRNLLPSLVGLLAVLVAVAVMVVIVDRVRGDDEPDRTLRVGALQIDIQELKEALEGLDLGDFRDFGDLGGLEALRDAFGDGSERPEVGAGPVLGVTVEEDGGAVVVQRVLPGTPADRAGVRAGDEIQRVAGRRIGDLEELRDALAEVEPGRDYELALRREGQRLTLEVDRPAFVASAIEELLRGLGSRFNLPRQDALRDSQPAEPLQRRPSPEQPATPPAPELGIRAVDAGQGVRVAQVAPGSGAEQAWFRPGDLIVGVGGRPIAALRERLRDFAPGDTLDVTVLRDGQRHQLRVWLSPPIERVEARPPSADPGQPRRDGRFNEDGRFSDAPARAPGTTPDGLRPNPELSEQSLERLADLVAGRLAARDVSGQAAPSAVPAPAAEPPAGLTAYFGRVAAIDDGSITLTGSLGRITLELTLETTRIGFKAAAIGDLVTVVTRDGVVQMLIVVG